MQRKTFKKQKMTVFILIIIMVIILHLLPYISIIEDSLYCSKSFSKAIKQDIYADLYSELIDEYEAVLRKNKNNKSFQADSLIIRGIQKDIFKQYNPIEPNILSCYTGSGYLSSYFRVFQPDISPQVDFGPYNKYLTLPFEMRMPLLGRMITLQYLYPSNEFDLQKAITYFESKYPDSEYLPIIKKLQMKANEGRHSISQENGEIFIDSTLIHSKINDIKSFHQTYFPNQKIFIDLWATWCAPCKMEFTHEDKLYPIAKDYNVKLVFLSIDDARFQKKWESDILTLNLKGYHFLVNEALLKDIKKIIYEDQSILVPRLYINEEGKIVNADAPRPSLINEIEKMFSGK